MSRFAKLTVCLAVFLVTTGCSTTIRNLTATYLTSDGVYVGYWEGVCRPILGCDIGDGKVQWCELNPDDNSLTCKEQTEVSALLDRKAK